MANNNATLLKALLGGWLKDHANAETAVKAAIDASLKDSKIQDAAKKDKESAWSRWLVAGQTLANEGADTELARMVIESLVGEDEMTVASVQTYKMRIPSLVPILALNDADYAAVWGKADITIQEKGQPVAVEPTRVFHNQIAAKLIKAFKNEAPTAKDRVNVALKLINAHVKGLMNPNVEALDTAQAKKDARAAGVAAAQDAVETVMGLLSIDDGQLPVVPETSEQEQESDDDSAMPQAAVG